MSIERERPEKPSEDEDEEYPAGSEVPAEPAGVGDNVEDADQPGMSEDPPRAD
jgi:hypothetical protein